MKKFPYQNNLLDFIKVRIQKTDHCWVWIGAKDVYGYGSLKIDGKQKKAHRVLYKLHKGDLKDELTIDHLCRNRACVNPEHLEAVTLEENKRRGNSPAALNARKTHCPKGHPYSKENTKTYVRWYGISRHCLTCNKERDQSRNRKTKKEH